MPDWSNQWSGHIVFSVFRWVHLVAVTLLVGGTLFFEFVVPEAIDDLKEEQQLSVFARTRWVFRRITWLCAILLPISGGVTMYRMWTTYTEADRAFGFLQMNVSGYWMAAHVLFGILAITIAVHVILSNARPRPSRWWMQMNFILLLAVMFLAVAARHVRLTIREKERDATRAAAADRANRPERPAVSTPTPTPPGTLPATEPTAQPGTLPATVPAL